MVVFNHLKIVMGLPPDDASKKKKSKNYRHIVQRCIITQHRRSTDTYMMWLEIIQVVTPLLLISVSFSAVFYFSIFSSRKSFILLHGLLHLPLGDLILQLVIWRELIGRQGLAGKGADAPVRPEPCGNHPLVVHVAVGRAHGVPQQRARQRAQEVGRGVRRRLPHRAALGRGAAAAAALLGLRGGLQLHFLFFFDVLTFRCGCTIAGFLLFNDGRSPIKPPVCSIVFSSFSSFFLLFF
mmetsp:Transcript_14750/g.23141  ORF Transcript_14750/g.23141 Transcript_14750/m.23141 type:complete len:238 (-) Transcript_14750:45-758(-)